MMGGIVLTLYRNGKTNTGITVGIPIGPAIIGSGLPEMPQSTVVTTNKKLQASIKILCYCQGTGKTSASASVGVPIGPTIIGSGLPEMPQVAILTCSKEFQAAISAGACYRRAGKATTSST